MLTYVVLHSGGLDSTTLLFRLLADGHAVIPFSVRYGQRHVREMESALVTWEHARERFGERAAEPIDVEIVLPKSVLRGSSQIDDDVPVPHGHYEDESMRATVVPNRNMLLLALAGTCAISNGAHGVAYAAHAGDHAIYPDCRADFVSAMRSALKLCHYDDGLHLVTPYLDRSKADIAREAEALLVPHWLTWSCYEGGDAHCGRCGTCVERIEAFTVARVADRTEYAR